MYALNVISRHFSGQNSISRLIFRFRKVSLLIEMLSN